MKKFAIFAFNGELMCFMHAMLNVIDLNEKGYKSVLVIEGEAVKLVEELQKGNPLFKKLTEENFIAGVCKACSAKLGVLGYNEKSGITLLDDMNGHPSVTEFIKDGYEIITM